MLLRPHSLLWHYLWLAPHILQALLAILMWRRRLYREFPCFFAYAVFQVFLELTLYGLDVTPAVSSQTFWRVYLAGGVGSGLLRFAVIGEIFGHVFKPYPSLNQLGKMLFRWVGAILLILATLAAAYTPIDDAGLMSYAHRMDQAVYLIQCGLILFLFMFAAYFRLTWRHCVFGIALGFGVTACIYLATWAISANGVLGDRNYLLDFINMATYHGCVLIWMFYLLFPHKVRTQGSAPVPPHDVELWNRELERLLQR